LDCNIKREKKGATISRVLSWVVIYLGRMSPYGSSKVFCQASLAIVRLIPYTSCYRQGLPSCPCYHRHWWALTPPFHLFRRSGSLLSVALALRLLWPPVRWSLVSLV